ncbi:MAG: tyrosine-type recombinase/integrase [Alphaproteobacteria bacterium]
MEIKLTKENVEKILHSNKPGSYSDPSFPRFFLRIQIDPRTGNVSSGYFITYRDKYGKKRNPSVANTKTSLTLNQIKEKAKKMLRVVDEGGDPLKDKEQDKQVQTVAELCELYMTEGTTHKKESTLKIDRGRIDHHIAPIIGDIRIKELNAGDVDKLMISIMKGNVKSAKESTKLRGRSVVTGGKEASNRTIQLLSAILNFAIRRELIEKNPAKLVNRPKAGKKEVFLNTDEIKKLGKALNDKQHKDKKLAIQAIKLLLLTGCRRDEVLSLQWDYVDFANQCFRFPDTKTGKQIRPFGKGALKLLEEIKKENSSQWVFPATRGDGHYIGLPKAFTKIYSSRPLKEDRTPDKDKPIYLEKEGLSLHSLRHSFASTASLLGFNEFTIAGLLGHRLRGVTSRYSHNVDKTLILSADEVSLYIEEALND